MAKKVEAQERIADFLEGRISLAEFEDWSAEYSWNIHKSGDDEAKSLAYLIREALNEHSDNDKSLRQELANALRSLGHAELRMIGTVTIHIEMPERRTYKDTHPVTTAEFVL